MCFVDSVFVKWIKIDASPNASKNRSLIRCIPCRQTSDRLKKNAEKKRETGRSEAEECPRDMTGEGIKKSTGKLREAQARVRKGLFR